MGSAIVHISQQDLNLSTYIGQIASLKEEFLTMMPLTPDVGAQQTQLVKFFMVLTLIGLRPDLESIRDQILGSSSVPSRSENMNKASTTKDTRRKEIKWLVREKKGVRNLIIKTEEGIRLIK